MESWGIPISLSTTAPSRLRHAAKRVQLWPVHKCGHSIQAVLLQSGREGAWQLQCRTAATTCRGRSSLPEASYGSVEDGSIHNEADSCTLFGVEPGEVPTSEQPDSSEGSSSVHWVSGHRPGYKP